MDEDDAFTKMATASLNWFDYWFTVHWVLYMCTITSFLSIALFFEIKRPQTTIFSCWILWCRVGGNRFVHKLMFLYPCFKAAAVTVSWEKLIKKSMKSATWMTETGSHPVPQEQEVWISYQLLLYTATVQLQHCVHFDLYRSPGSVAESNRSILSDTVHRVIVEYVYC